MNKIRDFLFVCLLFLSVTSSYVVVFSSEAESLGWEIVDSIKPTLDYIEWTGKGVKPGPPSWVSDGRWLHADSYMILVKSENYIFCAFSEIFNWDVVNKGFEREHWHSYESFEDFTSDVINNPSWWLMYSWGYALGANSLDKTHVGINHDEATGRVQIEVTCHVTNIPGFFMTSLIRSKEIGVGGEKLPDILFAGIDIKDIYLGDIEAFQLTEMYHADLKSYKIHLKAPANTLQKYLETYSFALDVAPQNIGRINNDFRLINITMPSETEAHFTSPPEISTQSENIVTFSLDEGEKYPVAFSVKSGPPIRTSQQIIGELVQTFLTEPEAWAILGSSIACIYAAFRGKHVWDRRKTYYRLYRSMVNTYERYSDDFTKFSHEIENLSKTTTQYFIEDKINDDQFDKLLTRRDDLIERARRQNV